MDGALRPWQDAQVHVASEALIRGVNVYEGLKGYWQADGRFGMVMLKRHYDRLGRSARLLHIPFTWTYSAYEAAVFTLVGRLLRHDRDMWARTTLFAVEGHWG